VTMNLYQPILFVGLGGTGCLIGGELERRLREEICGPDGTEFQQRRPNGGHLPYQLPACVQFVYADMNQADLDRLARRVVPNKQHIPAALQTAHYVRDLVPNVDTYPEVARNLRLSAGPVVEGWLPPPHGEPRVAPLQRGAGQLPTIGRAVLFETFRGGIDPAVRDLRRALGNLSGSGEDLYVLGGKSAQSVDVFVAFSVAGGTGAGIFYDYLHLIGNMFEQSNLNAKIYPLVLMPSAFPDGLGGGRAAELNAGRALLDLFRLVDFQNASDAERDLPGFEPQTAADPEDISVYYPVEGRVALRAATVQTGFLFSRPVGAEPDDLHRSVVSLVLSLVGTELDQTEDTQAEARQSFADSFINRAVDRQIPAHDGIGNRGVSTALVSSLTVPTDELADLVAGRLMRTAFEELASPLGGITENNRGYIEQFFTAAGVNRVLSRAGVPFAEPEPAAGAREIAVALADRVEAMQASLRELDMRLHRDMPELVASFDATAAAHALLGDLDLFRAQRVIFGHTDLPDGLDRLGVLGLMQHRRALPEPPDGVSMTPPTIPHISNRAGGLLKAKWADPESVHARQDQEIWYRWRTNAVWAAHWEASAPRWRRAMDQLGTALTALADALKEYARADTERFAVRAEALYRPRVGVTYLLPPGSGELEQFYRRAIRQLIDRYVGQGRLRAGSTEAELFSALIGPQGWREMFALAWEHTPEQALADLKDQIKTDIMTFLRNPEPGRRPLVPRLNTLLAAAAGQQRDAVSDDDLEEFRGKLAGLLPAAFTPQGEGPMKVLISYPAAAKNLTTEQYLKESIALPVGRRINYEYRPTQAESIAIVLFRTAMGITEVREVRDVLRLWADAQTRPLPQDHLRWRQRTGYDFRYLATREQHRVEILHRMLCAMWNGRVSVVEGDPASPDRIRIALRGVTMSLRLTPLEIASSWGSMLRAYEMWTFSDNDEIRRDFCRELMRELPTGLESRPQPPAQLYRVVCDLAKTQIERIDGLSQGLAVSGRERGRQLRDFWAVTLPAALEYEFEGLEAATRPNLSALEHSIERLGNEGTVGQ
jgi:Tubulin like